MRILLIEDDSATADYVAAGLSERGHRVEQVGDGRAALEQAKGEAYDLLIVDRMLPGLDGVSLVRRLRAEGIATPALFLSTLAGLDDRVTGLEAGGDDYLVKPFALAELAARVSALGRRPALAAETVLRIGDLELDLVRRSVTRGGRPIGLQAREFRLLEYLMRHAGDVVTRGMLLENVWDFHFDPQTTVVETHMSRLRAKIDRNFDPALIQTVRGHGYSIVAPV
ncbi:MAG TPA: response regulator transcription factor [Candidatus Cybelea sp.]|nr:response regulator transcription factor [Candidatus Cybelea sp.]